MTNLPNPDFLPHGAVHDDVTIHAQRPAAPSPGPFKVDLFAIRSANDDLIAFMSRHAGGSPESEAANARLLAAAPELLAAAKAVMARAIDIDHYADFGVPCPGCAATNLINAAIAKAEGRRS